MSSDADITPPPGPTNLTLWTGIALPILAFILQQQISFLLTPFVCHTGHRGVLYLVALIALGMAASGGFIARAAFLAVPERPPEELDRTSARRRFMALSGMLVSLFFCLVVIAMAIPGFVHRPCD